MTTKEGQKNRRELRFFEFAFEMAAHVDRWTREIPRIAWLHRLSFVLNSSRTSAHPVRGSGLEWPRAEVKRHKSFLDTFMPVACGWFATLHSQLPNLYKFHTDQAALFGVPAPRKCRVITRETFPGQKLSAAPSPAIISSELPCLLLADKYKRSRPPLSSCPVSQGFHGTIKTAFRRN